MSITNKIKAVHTLKEKTEEVKFINVEKEENVQRLVKNMDGKLNEADGKFVAIRQLLTKIVDDQKAAQRTKLEQSTI